MLFSKHGIELKNLCKDGTRYKKHLLVMRNICCFLKYRMCISLAWSKIWTQLSLLEETCINHLPSSNWHFPHTHPRIIIIHRYPPICTGAVISHFHTYNYFLLLLDNIMWLNNIEGNMIFFLQNNRPRSICNLAKFVTKIL